MNHLGSYYTSGWPVGQPAPRSPTRHRAVVSSASEAVASATRTVVGRVRSRVGQVRSRVGQVRARARQVRTPGGHVPALLARLAGRRTSARSPDTAEVRGACHVC